MFIVRILRSSQKELLVLIISILVAWSGFSLIRDVAEKAQWFHLTADEALHAEVIEVLSQTGRYANWNGTIFAPRLTTGPTLILPAAFLAHSTGWPGAVCGRIVSFFYFLLSLAMLIQLTTITPLKKLSLSLFTFGLFFIHWRALQDTHYYPFAILGEGPAIFFIISSIVFWRKKIFLAAGLFASLAALSKPYLLALPLWILFYSFSRLRRSAWLGVGTPFVFLGFAMILHAGWEPTWNVVRNYPSIMQSANGAGLSSTPLLELIHDKIERIPSILKWRGIILFALSMIFVFHTLTHKRRWEWMPFLSFTALHLLWWWSFSPGTQSRYLMPVYLILTLLNISSLAQYLLKRFHGILTPPRLLSLPILAGLIIVAILWPVQKSWREHWNNFENCGFCRQLAAQAYWKSLAPTSRPGLFALSQAGYAQDVDMVITAPYQVEPLTPHQPLPRSSTNWVTLGEFPTTDGLKRLQENGCRSVAVWGTQGFGYWNCRK